VCGLGIPSTHLFLMNISNDKLSLTKNTEALLPSIQKSQQLTKVIW